MEGDFSIVIMMCDDDVSADDYSDEEDRHFNEDDVDRDDDGDSHVKEKIRSCW